MKKYINKIMIFSILALTTMPGVVYGGCEYKTVNATVGVLWIDGVRGKGFSVYDCLGVKFFIPGKAEFNFNRTSSITNGVLEVVGKSFIERNINDLNSCASLSGLAYAGVMDNFDIYGNKAAPDVNAYTNPCRKDMVKSSIVTSLFCNYNNSTKPLHVAGKNSDGKLVVEKCNDYEWKNVVIDFKDAPKCTTTDGLLEAANPKDCPGKTCYAKLNETSHKIEEGSKCYKSSSSTGGRSSSGSGSSSSSGSGATSSTTTTTATRKDLEKCQGNNKDKKIAKEDKEFQEKYPEYCACLKYSGADWHGNKDGKDKTKNGCRCNDWENQVWVWDTNKKTGECKLQSEVPTEPEKEPSICRYEFDFVVPCQYGALTYHKNETISSDILDGKKCSEFLKTFSDENKIIEYMKKFCPTKPLFEESAPEPAWVSAKSSVDSFMRYTDNNKSVWKTVDGQFNTARLASDLTAGVVLGTVGGVVSGVVIKKNQVKKGFEALHCNVGGQKIADWGDEFRVGFR